MKLFFTQSSPATSSFVNPNSPQRPVLIRPQSMFIPWYEKPSCKPIQNNRYDECYFR